MTKSPIAPHDPHLCHPTFPRGVVWKPNLQGRGELASYPAIDAAATIAPGFRGITTLPC